MIVDYIEVHKNIKCNNKNISGWVILPSIHSRSSLINLSPIVAVYYGPVFLWKMGRYMWSLAGSCVSYKVCLQT